MKRILALLLALALMLPVAACAAAPEEDSAGAAVGRDVWADVPEGAEYRRAVEWCLERGLMRGVSDGSFDPEGTLTRAMVAAVLHRAEGEPAPAGGTGFSDVPAGQWYSAAVAWANERGLVEGYGNGLFGTEDPVTREQLDVILRRYGGKDPAWTGDPALAVPATRAQAAMAFYEGLVPEEDTVSGDGKTLVAYFSCTGNTGGVAAHIRSALGQAELYEILPAQPYTAADLNYSNPDCRANREQEDEGARPAMAGELPDLGEYDVVFLGYPIWWGRPPRILYTFLESYDWEGKTIVPFCTSGSSGYHDGGIRELAEGANWITGRRFGGGASQSTVTEWVESLELPRREEDGNVFYISAKGETLTADLADNPSAEAFRALLAEGAVTVSMDDYGGFEKVGPLGTTLPRSDARITAQPGDVILYQGSSVTIYYGQNSWNFTRLGRIRDGDQDRLRKLLGAGEGEVSITFSLEEDPADA